MTELEFDWYLSSAVLTHLSIQYQIPQR